jgi:nuclear pore complex protein Nup93
VRESAAATAVRDAQRGAALSFDEFIGARLDAEWDAEKRALLDAGGAGGALSAAVGPSPGGEGSPYYRGSAIGVGTAAGSPAPLRLRGRAMRYADVVRKINAAEATRRKIDAAAAFADACSADDGPLASGGNEGSRRTTIARVWQVLQRLLAGTTSLPPSARGQRETASIHGARRYLEENFQAYMQGVVAAHRSQAALGGAPDRLALIHAFLRVKERDRGPADFDQPGGIETTWQRIYLCLRAGYTEEALQLARAAPRAGGADFAQALKQWDEVGRTPLSVRGAAFFLSFFKERSFHGMFSLLPYFVYFHILYFHILFYYGP